VTGLAGTRPRRAAASRPRRAAASATGRGGKLRRVRAWLLGVPLFWRVYVTNALMLGVAFLGLILAPVTVSAPIAATELVLLAAGLAVLLAVNLALLRPAFGPFQELAETMRRHDPLSPGARARLVGGPDVVAIAQAFNEMLDRLEAERRDSARHALTAQEDERRRIARELHDEVGQTLTGVILQVEGLSATIPETLRPQLDELRETARHGTQEVRRIVRQLRPEALDELGLQSAIAVLATTFSEQTQIPVARRLEAAPALSREQELVVYRVAQEALTNVARHAQASHVELRFKRRGDWTVLAVRDDGRGIRSEELAASNGVRGMRERAMLIGAQLSIGAAAGGGTEVRLRIPLDRVNGTGA
jgi:two-component system, NarL family, sensor histidine kinase UhpB